MLSARGGGKAAAFDHLHEGRHAEDTVHIASPIVRKCKTLSPAHLDINDWSRDVRRMSPRQGAVAALLRPSQERSKPRPRAISTP